MNGGRYYKCFQGKKVRFVKQTINPQYQPGIYEDWICEETGLTNLPKRKGCSQGLKQGMQCVSCYSKNPPKQCRACVEGKDVFYCT